MILAPGEVDVAGAALAFDRPVMIAVAVACLPLFFTGQAVSRWEGALLLAHYGPTRSTSSWPRGIASSCPSSAARWPCT